MLKSSIAIDETHTNKSELVDHVPQLGMSLIVVCCSCRSLLLVVLPPSSSVSLVREGSPSFPPPAPPSKSLNEKVIVG